MPQPLIYAAQEEAEHNAPAVKPLAKNRRAAQRFVDKVTTSEWWKRNAPGYLSYYAPPPTHVRVRWDDDEDVGGMIVHHDKPLMVLGSGIVLGTPAVQDKWVILHELAHVMTNQIFNQGHHGQEFVYAYIALVRRWLGTEHASELVKSCKAWKIRLNYRLYSDLL